MKSVANEINTDLLFNNPQKFVVENQNVIEIIVKRYIKSGYLLLNNKNEMIQHINLRLLDGVIVKMQMQYDSKYFVSTYFACIVNNLCKEYLNIQKKDDGNVDYEEFAKNKASKSNPKYHLFVEEEVKQLDFIFRLYHNKKEKLIAALKIKYKLDVSINDIAKVQTSLGLKTTSAPLELSNIEVAEKTEGELFNYYAPYFEKSNGKQVSGDSLKRWTYQKIDEIISLLNQNGDKAYDLETLGILFEQYLIKNSNSYQNFIYMSS